MATAALSTNQQGASPIPGVNMVALMTITPGTSATAGEDLDLTAYFSTVDAIVPCGSTSGVVKYIPAFSFTPGATAEDDSVKFYCLVQDGAAGVLEPDNGTDLSEAGTFQVMVYGKAA